MAVSVLECIMLYYLQNYINLYKVSTLIVVIRDGKKICTSDHIALCGLWSYRFCIIYKYLQVIQPFVGNNLRFWDNKCMLKKLRDHCWYSEWSGDHNWLVLTTWYLHENWTLYKNLHWFIWFCNDDVII